MFAEFFSRLCSLTLLIHASSLEGSCPVPETDNLGLKQPLLIFQEHILPPLQKTLHLLDRLPLPKEPSWRFTSSIFVVIRKRAEIWHITMEENTFTVFHYGLQLIMIWTELRNRDSSFQHLLLLLQANQRLLTRFIQCDQPCLGNSNVMIHSLFFIGQKIFSLFCTIEAQKF